VHIMCHIEESIDPNQTGGAMSCARNAFTY
jgi:hypothetical protein